MWICIFEQIGLLATIAIKSYDLPNAVAIILLPLRIKSWLAYNQINYCAMTELNKGLTFLSHVN